MTTPDATLRQRAERWKTELETLADRTGEPYFGYRVEILRDLLALSAAPVGWVMVPKEPTEEMRKAGREAVVGHAWSNAGEHIYDPETIWSEMIAAVPPSASPAQAQATEGEKFPCRLCGRAAPLTCSKETCPVGLGPAPRATPPAEAREPATGKLKPCPFCGHEKPLHSAIRDGREIVCGKCRASVCAFSPDALKKAITAWNTRATPAPALVERATAVETAVGGAYEMLDGRQFWIDAPVAREITRRVMKVVGNG